MKRFVDNFLVRLVVQGLMILGLALGPHGSVEALELLDGDCSTACPCEAAEALERSGSDASGEIQDASEEGGCEADCTDCNCDVEFAPAMASVHVHIEVARLPMTRFLAPAVTPIPGDGHDIFIPPRR